MLGVLPPQPADVAGGGEDVPGGQGDDGQVCAGPRDAEPLDGPVSVVAGGFGWAAVRIGAGDTG
jgi:hypothetical protein